MSTKMSVLRCLNNVSSTTRCCSLSRPLALDICPPCMSLMVNASLSGRHYSVSNYNWTPSRRHGIIDQADGLTIHVSCRRLSRYVQGLVGPTARKKPPWRTLFFGTDEYALAHLRSLNENRVGGDLKVIDTLDVAVPKSKCPVRSYAVDNGLPLLEWPLSPLTPNKYDVGVVVSFGHLIPKKVIDAFPYGILNVHPSILPRWRGAAPIIHTILNGERETGISIMEIRPAHFDVGPLLLQVKYAVPENCSSFQLRDYLAIEGATLLKQALQNLPQLERREYEQAEYGVTYAHKLSCINGRVNWEADTLDDIDRQYRALAEIFGLRSQWRNYSVRLSEMVPPVEMQADDIKSALEAAFPEAEMTVRPGIAHYLDTRDILCIRCRDGWVGFNGITVKKPMTAKSFYNGYLSRPEHHATAFDSQSNQLERFKFQPAAAHNRIQPVDSHYRHRDYLVQMCAYEPKSYGVYR